jgi:hypothetical protein
MWGALSRRPHIVQPTVQTEIVCLAHLFMAEQARSGCANRKKARQSSKKKGYYQAQFNVTARNKHRRKAKAAAKKAKWAEIKAKTASAVDAVGTK